MSTETENYKPKKSTFIGLRIWFPLVLFGCGLPIAAVVMWLADLSVLAVVPLLAMPVLCGLVIVSAFAAHRKESYEFHSDRLVAHRGGLVSDSTSELDIRNITHVRVRLPWPRYALFGIGDVKVESAGSASSQVHLRHVPEPEKVGERLKELMRANGYSLKEENLLHEENPDPVGVLIEVAGFSVVGLFASLFFLGPLLVEPIGAVCIALPGLLWGGFFLVLRYLDMRRRTYQVYDDMVVYTEGFLTRDNAFMPGENLADAATKQTFWDRILGLYDVAVSCQGSSSEVKFRRLKRGNELSDAIDTLVERSSLAPRPTEGKVDGDADEVAEVVPGRAPTAAVAAEDAWTADLVPDRRRALVGLVVLFPLFLFPPIWLLIAFSVVMKTFYTRFEVRPNSIKSEFKAMSSDIREFTYDKITGVVVRKSFVDDFFGTVNVKLWSIGSPKPLELFAIREDTINLPALLRQCGIGGTEVLVDESAKFSLVAWARSVVANLGWVCPHGVLWGFVYYPKQVLQWFDDHVVVQSGVIVRERIYAPYAHIKKVRLTQYPGSDLGWVRVFVAGETRTENKNGQQGPPVQNMATAYFIDGIEEKRSRLDAILRGARPDDPAPEPVEAVIETGVSVPRAVGGLLLVSIIILPLVLFLPITLPWTALSVSRWRIRLESDRVVFSGGLVYKWQESVLLDRVDSINQAQGFVDKLFGNGKVTLFTAGSSRPDLALTYLPDHTVLYDAIRERLRQS
jgi:uncharacterized membrane protein YdbT with pleckstrin-like domain